MIACVYSCLTSRYWPCLYAPYAVMQLALVMLRDIMERFRASPFRRETFRLYRTLREVDTGPVFVHRLDSSYHETKHIFIIFCRWHVHAGRASLLNCCFVFRVALFSSWFYCPAAGLMGKTSRSIGWTPLALTRPSQSYAQLTRRLGLRRGYDCPL